MRIVFIGASDLGRACCEALLDSGLEVVGILTAPRDFRISWSKTPVRNVRHGSFDDLAAAHGIPCETMTTRMADCASWLAGRQPDLLVVIGWYHMIGASLRKLASLGAVGIHASLLPRYRGGAPLVWAMINGERETGVTLFHLGDGVDDGDIVGQEAFPIGERDTIADVVARSTDASVRLVRRYIPMLAAGNAPRLPQDHRQATVVPQRSPEDGVIDWSAKSARQAYDWIRAQTRPYPGAFTMQGDRILRIWSAEIAGNGAEGQATPGTFVSADLVVCADGRLLRLTDVQAEEPAP